MARLLVLGDGSELWRINPDDPDDVSGDFGLVGTLPSSLGVPSGISHGDGRWLVLGDGSELWRINPDDPDDVSGDFGLVGTLPSSLGVPSGISHGDGRWLVLGDGSGGSPSAPPAPTLTVLLAVYVQVAWTNTGVGADIARAPTGERGDLVEVIATNVEADPLNPAVTLYIDQPPSLGVWDYRLRRPSGPDGLWGPWATAFVTEKVMAPTLTVTGATVTVAWPETVGAVDIRVRRLVNAALHVLVIAENEDGTIDGTSRTYDDTPATDVPLWYSIRHPVSSGQWSDWAGPVTTAAPPPAPPVLNDILSQITRCSPRGERIGLTNDTGETGVFLSVTGQINAAGVTAGTWQILQSALGQYTQEELSAFAGVSFVLGGQMLTFGNLIGGGMTGTARAFYDDANWEPHPCADFSL